MCKSFCGEVRHGHGTIGRSCTVNQEMTVQVEQWWNSSDVATPLRQENVWDTDDTVGVVGKRKKYIRFFALEGLQHQHKWWSTTIRHYYLTTAPTWKKRLSIMGTKTLTRP